MISTASPLVGEAIHIAFYSTIRQEKMISTASPLVGEADAVRRRVRGNNTRPT
jgi:hypothetical protein